MTGYVYLVKKDDFYMIGSGGNMQRQMNKIKPVVYILSGYKTKEKSIKRPN